MDKIFQYQKACEDTKLIRFNSGACEQDQTLLLLLLLSLEILIWISNFIAEFKWQSF